jgi:hypothetical protein
MKVNIKALKFLPPTSLVIAAYMAMGDGTCSRYRIDRTDLLRKDVCGPAAPYYWHATERGRSYDIYKCTTVDTCFLNGGTNCGHDYGICTKSVTGNYTEPILLECPVDSTGYFMIKQGE